MSVGVKVGQGVGWCEGGTGCRLVSRWDWVSVGVKVEQGVGWCEGGICVGWCEGGTVCWLV